MQCAPQTLSLGTAYEGFLLVALLRDGTPEDAHPGKPQPCFVFNVLIKGVDKPVITVRLPSLGVFACSVTAPPAR